MRIGVYIAWLHQTNTGFVRCRTVLCAKIYKIMKIGLKPRRKKIRSSSSSGGGGCEIFSKRYKGHHRCLLPRLLGVGRLAAVTVNTDHGAYGVGVSHWQCC